MHIIIGSANPIKFQATQTVLSQVFVNATFGTQTVPSGVRPQPWGDEETRQGAFNRAKAVLKATPAQVGVGLEGGVVETSLGLMTTAWCVVMHHNGDVGVGGGVNLLLPPTVAQQIYAGAELGDAMDTLTGEHNTKQKEGAIGILTDGLLDRQRAYQVILQLAVAPFRRPDYYEVNVS